MTGQDPVNKLIDHIDGNPYNNRFNNLRLATRHQNGCNQKKHSNNTSGFKGVCWHKVIKKWQAYITVEGQRVGLGYFGTKEEAYAVYCEAAKNYTKILRGCCEALPQCRACSLVASKTSSCQQGASCLRCCWRKDRPGLQ
jgi:hypothetical protein